jgi:hypothetical protein
MIIVYRAHSVGLDDKVAQCEAKGKIWVEHLAEQQVSNFSYNISQSLQVDLPVALFNT